MPSGWTRLILEQFEFPFEVVYPPQLDAGDLKSKFDVLVFVDGGTPAAAAVAAVAEGAAAARLCRPNMRESSGSGHGADDGSVDQEVRE